MSQGKVYAAILAGGHGSRMGAAAGKPKQFLEIGGRPILALTLDAFMDSGLFEEILVVTPKEWIDYTVDCLKGARVRVIEGGADRSESLMNAIRYLEKGGLVQEDSILVSHDAVRPFIDQRILKENVEQAKACGACATLIPATDTIAVSTDGRFLDEVPERKTMYHMQTPQSFNIRLYEACFEALTEAEKASLTDASRVFLLRGRPVSMVEGRRENIKITYPQDLEFASKIIL